MANPYFEFKQFIVYQDRCAMKVGTDGVLLGVLADINFFASNLNLPIDYTESKEYPGRVLDIGTGTGLVSLIAAQRLPLAIITAVEIDPDSAMQAEENFNRSKFASRLNVIQTGIQDFYPDEKYDLILCNPPFYNGTLTCPDDKRTLARHALSLTFNDLALSAERLLSDNGEFVVIIPTYAEEELSSCCSSLGLYPIRITRIYPNEQKAPKRVVIQYSRSKKTLAENKLVIEKAPAQKTDEFKALVEDYYLRC